MEFLQGRGLVCQQDSGKFPSPSEAASNTCCWVEERECTHAHTHAHADFFLALMVSFLSRLVDLSGALRYEGVELDSCLLVEKVRGAVLPDEQDTDPTVDPAHLPVVPPTQLSVLTPGALTVTGVFHQRLIGQEYRCVIR